MTEALIFDLDGTLVSSSHHWIAAEDELITLAGGERTPEISKQFSGRRLSDMSAIVHRAFEPEMPVAECARLLEAAISRRFREGLMDEMPGAVALVKRLSGRVPLAVASGTPVALIEVALEKVGLESYFDLLVSSEDVELGKPAPDVFLETARRLGAEPANCVVFEDSLAGLESALAAGMRVIIRPRGPHVDDLRRLAPRIVESWDEVAVEDLFGDD